MKSAQLFVFGMYFQCHSISLSAFTLSFSVKIKHEFWSQWIQPFCSAAKVLTSSLSSLSNRFSQESALLLLNFPASSKALSSPQDPPVNLRLLHGIAFDYLALPRIRFFFISELKSDFIKLSKPGIWQCLQKSVKTFPKSEPSWTKESLWRKEFKQVWRDLQLYPDLWHLALQGLTAHSLEFNKDETLWIEDFILWIGDWVVIQVWPPLS